MSAVDRLYRRILMMISPAQIAATNDDGPVHKVQVRLSTTGEILDDVAALALYGIASHAPVGSDAAVIFVSGDRSSPIIIATNNQKFRLKGLKQGEVGLYTDEGDFVKLSRGKVVEIKAATKLRIDTPRLEVTGDIIDHCDGQAHTVQDMRNIYNAHTHNNEVPVPETPQ